MVRADMGDVTPPYLLRSTEDIHMNSRKRSNALRLGAIAALLTACSDRGVRTPLGGDESAMTPQFRVVVDASQWEKSTTERRRAAEREAVAAIIARFNAEHQEQVRRLLEGTDRPSGSFMAVVSVSDPETARLLGIVQSIRSAEAKSQVPSAVTTGIQRDVRVTIALVPQLARPGVRVTVIRRPGDAGHPLLLLRESDVTAADLELGLNVAALSFKRYGTTPTKERTLHLGSPRPSSRPRSERIEGLLELVKAGLPRHIDGIGTVRSMAIVTPLDRAPPP